MNLFEWNFFIIVFFILSLATDCFGSIMQGIMKAVFVGIFAAIPTLILHAIVLILT